MTLTAKYPRESIVLKSELVLPNDTNTLNNLMGGRLMYLMDVVGAICALRHCNNGVVTASVDNVSFREPIALGNIVTLQAKVTRAFQTSMEVHIEVWAEDIPNNKKIKSNEAFFTFVALNENKKPIPIPEVIPETDQEKELFASALRRRQLRLILAGRMKPSEATELKLLFEKI
ncbi:MAG: acyl-CoA thioesterase [Cytophagales bacterium]|nr:acyl-CoA thioesterase [Cytophaga sp.]